MKTAEVPDKYAPGWMDQLDGRFAVAKDVRGRFDQLTEDLGGIDAMSYQQRSLAERSVWLEFWLASQERELAQGKTFAIGAWVQATNSLLGLYAKLGIERKKRPAEDLQSYMRRVAAEKALEAQAVP